MKRGISEEGGGGRGQWDWGQGIKVERGQLLDVGITLDLQPNIMGTQGA